MKVAIITDQHFGARNDSIHFLDFYEKFYSEIFFPVLADNHINTVLILGDTFDRRKYINFYSYKRAREMFFDKLYDKNIEVYMLAGNHDTYFKNTNDVNSVDLLLGEYNNITVIDSPKDIIVDNTKICMLPWICAENYDESMKIVKETESKLCMGHLEIDGFTMHRGMVSEGGLNREIFGKFDMVFSGHYHHKSSSDNIHYLGNPYELTWQDYADTRGFHLFDTDTYNLEFIPNTNLMFHRITYDDKASSISDIMEVSSNDFAKYTNTYVKVVVLNKTNPYLFDKFIAHLYDVNPIDVTIVEDHTDLTEGVEDDTIDQAQDTMTIIEHFVDGIKEEHINSDKLKTVMKELYVEALNLEQV